MRHAAVDREHGAQDATIVLGPGDALIVVDVQKDFLPGGSLAVPQGEEVVPVLNEYAARFSAKRLPVFPTRDWHPANHVSFRAQGGPWPPHCVQGTAGAEFADDLKVPEGEEIVSKGATPDQDSYSDFEGTGLDRRLRELGVRRVFVGGLATDYCVLNTVLDARRLGYEVFLLADAVRAVEVHPGDGRRAVEEMLRRGARTLELDRLEG